MADDSDQLAPGEDAEQKLRSGGYGQDQIDSWKSDTASKLKDGGYDDAAIQKYFGSKPFNPAAMKSHVTQNLAAAKAAREPVDTSLKQIPANDFMDSLAAGWGLGTTNLMSKLGSADSLAGAAPIGNPDATHLNRMNTIGNMIGQMAGDMPAMAAGWATSAPTGALLGGTVGSAVPGVGTLGGIALGSAVGGMAGANAAPAGLRKLLVDHYEKGDIKDSGDFMNRLSAASWEAIKAGTIGAATGAAGYGAGQLAAGIGAKPFAAATGAFTAELSTMATSSAAMEKRLPNMDDFTNAAIVMGGLHAVTSITPKLLGIFKATGERPEEIVRAADTDPVLKQELFSNNSDLPKIEVPSEEEQAKLGLKPVDENGKIIEQEVKDGETPDKVTEEHVQAAQTIQVAKEAAEEQKPQPEPEPPGPEVNPNLSDDEKEMAKYVGASDVKPDDSAMGAIKRDIVNFWRKEDTAGNGDGFKSEFLGKAWDEVTDFYIKHFDISKGMRKAMALIGSDPEITKNPEVAVTLHGEIGAKIRGFFEENTRDFKTQDSNGEGYDQIMRDYEKAFPEDKQKDGLRLYGMAKRVVEKAKQGMEILVNTGGNPDGEAIDPKLAQRIVDAGKDKYESFNQRRIDFRNRVLQYAHDSGFWTPDQFKAMLDQNESYMSFHRIQELDPMFGQKGGARGVFKMKGIGNLIVDPLVSDIKDTAMLIKMAEENKVKQTMIGAFATGGDDALLTRVEPDLKVIKVAGEELSKELDRQGIEHDQDALDGMDVFRSQAARNGPGRIEINVNGERQVFEGDKGVIEIANALKGNAPAAGMFSKMLSTAAAGIRAGTINAWAFMTKHSTRNEITGGTYSETGMIPFISPAMEALDFFGKDKPQRVKDFYNDGAAQSSVLAFDDNYINSRITSIQKEAPFWDKAYNLVQNSAQISHAIILANDNLIRYTEYSRLLDQGKSRTEAAYGARRVLPDVQTMGLQRSFWLAQTAFLGIHVRSMVRQGEAVADQISQSGEALGAGNLTRAMQGPLARAVAFITMPAAMSAAWNYLSGSEDRIDRLLPWQKYGYFNIAQHSWDKATPEEAANMPHDDLKRQLPDGSWQIDNGVTWRMQMPFTQGVFFGGAVQMALDTFKDKSPEHFKDWAENVAASTVALPIPNFIQPVAAQTTNYDAFSGQPVIPENKLQLAPELQYEPYTTETAKAIGKLVGMTPAGALGPAHQKLASPMIVEEYVRDWTGPIGMGAMKLADYALEKSGVIPDKGESPKWEWADYPVIGAFCWRNQTFKTADIDKFINSYQTATTNKKSVKEYAKQGLADDAQDFQQRHEDQMNQFAGVYKAIHNQKTYIQSITANKDMSADDKRQLIEPVFYRMDEMAKTANKQMEDMAKAIKDAKGVH